MIIDDSVVVCGSANINDRSLTGKRDSEVCVVIQVSLCPNLKVVRTKNNLLMFRMRRSSTPE